ncbi:MAG TPA: hypothetical protein VNA25_23035, partial [Phycisphaerae bacterium]|nr:hypothetical protein [Phycisphaerae bacterium]
MRTIRGRGGRGTSVRVGGRRTPVTQNEQFARADEQAEALRAERDLRAQQGQEQAGLSRQFRGQQAGMGISAAQESQREAAVQRFTSERMGRGESTTQEQIAQFRQALGGGGGVGTQAAPREKLISVRGRMVPAAQAQEVFKQAGQRVEFQNQQLRKMRGITGAPTVPVSNYGPAAQKYASQFEVTDIPADPRFDTGVQRQVRQFATQSARQRVETGVQEGLQREIDDLLNTANQLEATQPQQPQQAPEPAPAAAQPVQAQPAQQLPVTPQDQARDQQIAQLQAQLAALGPAPQPTATPAAPAVQPQPVAQPAPVVQPAPVAPVVQPAPVRAVDPNAPGVAPTTAPPLGPVAAPQPAVSPLDLAAHTPPSSRTAESRFTGAENMRLTDATLRDLGKEVQKGEDL